VARGAYFASVLDEDRNAIEPWTAIPAGWESYLAHDFGSSAPSVLAQRGNEKGLSLDKPLIVWRARQDLNPRPPGS